MPNLYIIIGLLSLTIGFVSGWEIESHRFQKFREAVSVAQKVAEVETKRKEEESQNVTRTINNAYQSDIAAIHHYYAGKLQHSSSGKLPSISLSPARINENSTDPGFIEACADTTLQLNLLQQWIKEEQKVWMKPTAQK